MSDYLYDVFVSHASQDKAALADGLVKVFEAAGLRVWYDSSTLAPGDRLNDNVRLGIERSRFFIAVVSEHFIQNHWTKHELALLVQTPERLLQVWHGVDGAKVRAFNAVLADQVAVPSTGGSHAVGLELLRHMRIRHEIVEPIIEHYHGSARVTASPSKDHYVEVLEVGGLFRVPRGQPLVYKDQISFSSPQGKIELFKTVPSNLTPRMEGQAFEYFHLAGAEHASIMSINGLMHATKKFALDDGFVAVRLPYFCRFVTLTFDYSGFSFDMPEVGARVVAQSPGALAPAEAPSVTHWPEQRYLVLQARDLPAGSNPMLCWGKWLK